jgi:hypothetical protein
MEKQTKKITKFEDLSIWMKILAGIGLYTIGLFVGGFIHALISEFI